MSFREEIQNYINASYPCIYVVAREEWRAIAEIQDACKSLKPSVPCHTWTITNGLDYNFARPTEKKLTDPEDFIKSRFKPETGVYCLVNFHYPNILDTPIMIQLIKDCIQVGRTKQQILIFVSNVWKVPQELVGDITRVDFSLPDKKLLNNKIDFILDSIDEIKRKDFVPTEDERESILEAGLGMTTWEFENTLSLSLIKNKKIDAKFIGEEKAKTVAKSGILEFYTPNVNMNDVGGLENLKEWLKQRRKSFSIEAQKYGLPSPKGILLIGIPGSGKSMSAKAMASDWGLPLIRFDLGKLFQGLVGASEERTRQAIELAEAVAPAIIWIDEIEKGMAGVGGSGNTDSGVTARVFGSLLTWLNEKTRPVFVVATANQIQNLPPELMRAGRWDEIFFIDLPHKNEREEIVRIHIKKKNRNPDKFNINKIVEETEQFSGAELESVIIKAMTYAFADDREFTTDDILKAASKTVPLAVMRKEEIEALREWAKNRAVFASKEPENIVVKEKRKLSI